MASLAEQRKKILRQLDALKGFGNTAAVKKLRQELTRKLDALELKTSRGRKTRLPISKAARKRATNAARASKLRKYHNYLRQIRDNYPGLKYSDLRRQFSERKEGKHTKVPDVIWRNPSP